MLPNQDALTAPQSDEMVFKVVALEDRARERDRRESGERAERERRESGVLELSSYTR